MALDATDNKPTNVAGERLRSIVDRIERLEEERKALGNDIKDIYSEAKSAGFDVKVLRQLIRIRKQEPAMTAKQFELPGRLVEKRNIVSMKLHRIRHARLRRAQAPESSGFRSIFPE